MFTADPGQQAASGSEPIELITQARVMGERNGADDVLLKAAVNESHLLEGAGEHERAAEAACRATASADAQRVARVSGSLLAINRAEPLLALGRWDEAVKIANGAIDFDLAPGPMHRASLRVVAGTVAIARGDLATAAQAVSAARDMTRSARYEDQHQLPLTRLEIMLALASAGSAAAMTTALQAVDRFDLPGSSPRYAWPVVVAAASAVLAAARQAGAAHDERLRDQAAAAAERLRTVAEKLESFGRLQQGLALTFAAADAQAGFLLAASGPAGGASLTQAWDRAAAAWADLSEPYPLAEARRSRSSRGGPGSRWRATNRRRGRIPELGSLAVSLRCLRWSRPGEATGTSPPSCSSHRRRRACTCPTSSASWAPPTAAKPRPRLMPSACSNPSRCLRRRAVVIGACWSLFAEC
jgi:hypothetical protein